MPTVQATLEYLQKLPLYKVEKPYWCFLAPKEGFDPDAKRVDNLEFEHYPNITIHNIRDLPVEPKIGQCGFEVLSHKSEFSSFKRGDDITQYRLETEELLKEALGAVLVKCYDSRLRKNVPFQRAQLDLNDPLLTEGPARGVHNGKSPAHFQSLTNRANYGGIDITYDSGPAVIARYLSEDDQAKYLKDGYRVRIVK